MSRPRRSMALPFPLLLAARYLRSSRRDAFVSLLSVLAAGGMVVGVAALVVVMAALSGLQIFLRSDVLARTPHLEIELPAGADPVAVEAELATDPAVESTRRVLRARGWLVVGSSVRALAVVGFEGTLPSTFPDATDTAEGLYLPERLARSWGLIEGDVVEIVSPRPSLTPFGPQPRIRRLPLTGTFAGGRTETVDQQRAAIPLATARQLFGDQLVRIEARTVALDTARRLAPRLAAELPAGSRVRTWEDLNRPLFFALRLEKTLMFVAIFLIVPIAAMALVTVMALLIAAKRGEIAILQAMGAAPRMLRHAFLVLGSSLAVFGIASGVILGSGLAVVLDRYELLAPPGDVYFVDHVPFVLTASDLAVVVGAALSLALGATVWAAWRVPAQPAIGALNR